MRGVGQGRHQVKAGRHDRSDRDAEGATAVIGVADNGCGIRERLQNVIFELFFTTKEVGRGTGHALASAQAVANGHAGTTDVLSAPCEDADFILRIPVHGKTPEQA